MAFGVKPFCHGKSRSQKGSLSLSRLTASLLLQLIILVWPGTSLLPCEWNQSDRRDPTASTRHFVARSLRDVGVSLIRSQLSKLGRCKQRSIKPNFEMKTLVPPRVGLLGFQNKQQTKPGKEKEQTNNFTPAFCLMHLRDKV